MGYYDYRSFEHHSRWWNPLENTTLTSTLLAVVVGAYTLFKVLDVLGYPVRLWLHHSVHMSVGVLRLRGASSTFSDTESADGTMQRGAGMLGSIFGLNDGSLLRKGVRGLTSALSSASSNVPPGLGNISNSCYQNSVIQGLTSLPSLRDYLAQMVTENPLFTTETTNGALYDMIRKLNHPTNQGQSFWIRGKLKSMSTFQQQDAQEYYSKILDELDNEAKKASSSKRRTSLSWLEVTKSLNDASKAEDDGQEGEQTVAEQAKIVPNPLDGLIAQRVGCTTCGYSEGLSLISFNCITVSLGSNLGYDIRECLDEYTKLEYIDGVECAKCTLLKLQKTLMNLVTAHPGSPLEARLNAVSEAIDEEKFDDNTLVKTLNIPKKNWVQSSKSKQIVVARAPKALVLHVNRSIFDEMTGRQYKNSAGVSYPGILDLGNWCLGSSPSGSRQPDMSLEEWPRDPRHSMLQGHKGEPMKNSPFQYRLRAAVTHYGSHGYGHYVCYRPHSRAAQQETGIEDIQKKLLNSGEQWWRFSDDNVYAVPEEQAHQGNVFMLFYERLEDDKSALPPLPEAQEASCTFAIPKDTPLPPADVVHDALYAVEAVEVPLPEDDDLFDLIPPESPVSPPPAQIQDAAPDTEACSTLQNSIAGDSTPSEQCTPVISAYPTPPPEIVQPETISHDPDTETETSEAESEDAPSAHPEGIPAPSTPKPFLPPHLMRTAGNAASRGQGSRQSLPLVSAT